MSTASKPIIESFRQLHPQIGGCRPDAGGPRSLWRDDFDEAGLRVTVVAVLLALLALLAVVVGQGVDRAAPVSISTGLGSAPLSTPASNAALPRSALMPVAVSPAADRPTVKQQVARLSVGTPAEKFVAYEMLARCAWAMAEEKETTETNPSLLTESQRARKEGGDLARAVQVLCGDLSALDTAKRLALVEAAAEAGVPMAALRMAREGPFGDPSALWTRPEDPLVLAWRARVGGLIHLAAERGDTLSLISLVNQYASGEGVIGQVDIPRALAYAIAMQEVYERQNGKPMMGGKTRITSLSAELSAEQVQAAREQGRQIASDALAFQRGLAR